MKANTVVTAIAFPLQIAMIVMGKCFIKRFQIRGSVFVSVVKFNA